MPINWNFNPNNVKDVSFKPIPAGEHRLRIEDAEAMTSSGGNPMVKITFAVSGYKQKIFHYLVLTPEYGDTKLKQIWDSFGIPIGTLDEKQWIGKVGAARTKITQSAQYGDRAEIAYIISRDKQDKLPPWQEPEGSTPAGVVPFDTSDIPF